MHHASESQDIGEWGACSRSAVLQGIKRVITIGMRSVHAHLTSG